MVTKERASLGNRIGMMVVAAAVFVLIVVMLYRSYGMKQKISYYQRENAALEEQIVAQKERSSELDRLPEYIRSDEYVEKVAREKFGLVYPEETVIRPEE